MNVGGSLSSRVRHGVRKQAAEQQTPKCNSSSPSFNFKFLVLHCHLLIHKIQTLKYFRVIILLNALFVYSQRGNATPVARKT
jgi:hypothetical protein